MASLTISLQESGPSTAMHRLLRSHQSKTGAIWKAVPKPKAAATVYVTPSSKDLSYVFKYLNVDENWDFDLSETLSQALDKVKAMTPSGQRSHGNKDGDSVAS
eukprot:2135031-Amphidinium_carterae.1